MEEKDIQTWKCPSCGEEENTENFCTKCGAPKPVEKKEKPKRDVSRAFNTVVSVFMIIFFSTALIYILTPVIELPSSDVGGYYFLWEAWPYIKNMMNSGSTDSLVNIEIGRTIAGLIVFLAAAVLVYIHAIRGLVNSIMVLKKNEEVKYSNDLAWVVGTTLVYYGIIYSLYWETNNWSVYNGGGKVYAVISMVLVLISLLIGSFIIGCSTKNGGKIATSTIRFASLIFGLSGTLVAMKGAIRFTNGYTTTSTSFILQAMKQFSKGVPSESLSGAMFIVVGVLILLAIVAGAISVSSSFKCLVKEGKSAALTYISGFASAGLIIAALVTSSIFITVIDFGSTTASVTSSLATALTFTLISSVGLIVANLLDR